MRNFALLAIVAMGLVVPTFAVAKSISPYGDWTLNDGRLTVRAAPCSGGLLCANVVRLQEPNNGDGTPKLDLKNKNAALRSRRLIGMPVIEGMVPTSSNTWKGRIYSSDDGNYYRAYARLEGDHFNVKGCWFVICKTLEFYRSK